MMITMSKMFRYDEALENAIKKNELDKLMCGESMSGKNNEVV